MRISLSGRMSIEVGETVVEESRLGGARARLAFAVLVLERPGPVDRHHLAEVLWPGDLPASWEAALRVVVSRVRAFVGAAGLPAAEMLTSSYGCYRLTLPDDVVVDVEAAARAVDAAEAAAAAGDHRLAVVAAGEARTLLARPFIAGAEGEWLDAARRRQGSQRRRALDVLVRSAIRLGDGALAVEAAQELLGLDPYRDASHVLIMQAHRTAGNRAEALRAYGWCRHVLVEELGVDPAAETERLYRSLLHEEHGGEQTGEEAWAPSATVDAPHNLPSYLSSFVGRERELREIRKALEGDRLVTLLGPGGSGKTRLALEVAGRALAAHPDGTWLVDLAPLAPDAVVAPTVAAAVGVVEQPSSALVDSLVDHLRDRDALLVVDNCEHVLGATATLVDALLRACPRLWVLATSREPLGVPGEVRWRVPSLSTPERGEPDSIDVLLGFEAPRLFVERCRSLVADHAFTDADAAVVSEICARLDGNPLAIELAAACITTLDVGQIAARLDDRFRLLTLGPRTVAARHQSLQGAVDWSHDLLGPDPRVLLRRLSVFAGGFTLEAAEAVVAGGDLDRDEVLDRLVGLVNASMVMRQTTASRTRYYFHDTIRQFAHDRLVEAGEEEQVRHAHLAWCAALIAEAEPELTGADQQAWFERLDTEIDNLRAALAWACSQAAADDALRIAGGLTFFWHVRSSYEEGRRWMEAALAIGSAAPSGLRAHALWGLGFLALALGDVATTVAASEECLSLTRAEGVVSEGSAVDTARALSVLGELASAQDVEVAHRLLEESAQLARAADDAWCLSCSLASRAQTELLRGPSAAGRALVDEAMAVARAAGDTRSQLRAASWIAWGALQEGDYAIGGAAERALDLGLVLARRLGDTGRTSLLLSGQGELAWRRGDTAAAARLLEESAEIGRRLRSPVAGSLAHGLLGRRSAAMGDLEGAARWFDSALEFCQVASLRMAVPWWTWGRADVARRAGDHQAARIGLDEARSQAEAVGNDVVVAATIWAEAQIARSEGRLDDASDLHRDGLRRRDAVGDGAGIIDSLESLAGLTATATAASGAGGADRAARAVRLLAAAGALRSATGCARPAVDQAGYDTDLDRARAGLSADAFEQAWAEGRGLSRPEAVALALADEAAIAAKLEG